jgi:hypothetical protein
MVVVRGEIELLLSFFAHEQYQQQQLWRVEKEEKEKFESFLMNSQNLPKIS